jgi:hypothetical protein
MSRCTARRHYQGGGFVGVGRLSLSQSVSQAGRCWGTTLVVTVAAQVRNSSTAESGATPNRESCRQSSGQDGHLPTFCRTGSVSFLVGTGPPLDRPRVALPPYASYRVGHVQRPGDEDPVI